MQKPDQSIRNRLLLARLPAMPQILVRLLDLCQKDDAGMNQLANLISHDAGMTARILGVANSSAYRRSSLTLDLSQSLNTLGTDMIKTLVMNTSVFQTFNHLSRICGTDLDFRGFWVHSLKTAVIARELAIKMSYPRIEEAYLAGLLHDVGRLALLSVAPQEYVAHFMAQDDESLCHVEVSQMGLMHAGAWLIEQWNLDSFLADSVRYHHEPFTRLASAHPLIRLVCLAHLWSNYSSESPLLAGASALCGVNDADMKEILSGAHAHTVRAAADLGIELGSHDEALPTAEYKPRETVRNLAEERLADEIRTMALVNAVGQSFSSMKSGKHLIETIARTARVLFDFDDVAVLIVQKNSPQILSAFPMSKKHWRLGEFSIPLEGSGIISEAINNCNVFFAGCSGNTRVLFEEQLLRIMGTECMACMPLMAGQTCLGVLVGGLSAVKAEDLWGRERFLKSFASQATASIESSPTARDDIEKYLASADSEV
jgi:HD-like signal output (HDOD) protein